MNERQYTSRRYSILVALSEAIKEISNANGYNTQLDGLVYPRMAFWDEVKEYPTIHMALGTETRVYQGGGYKDRFLNITLRCYVKAEDPQLSLELLLEDIETVIEQNGRLAYQDSSGTVQMTQDITIVMIDTDEGALAPLGVGEMILQVRY